MARPKRSPLRRLVLAAAALLGLAGPLSSGCAAGFEPISKIEGLRVLAVTTHNLNEHLDTTNTYGAPGDTLRLGMTYVDSHDRPITVVWLGGCFDPPGDTYYGCYDSLSQLFQGGFDLPSLLASGYVGIGDSFNVTLPDDIISRRPPPAKGQPYYGLAYVFFAACAGHLGPAPAEGTGVAGSFPIGCFDDDGNRLGADSFVPGYTQIYAFADGRTNGNPIITGMSFDMSPVPEGGSAPPTAERCPVSDEDRLSAGGCGKKDYTKECTGYELTVDVPEGVAEVDPSGKQEDGTPLHETVWVDYFAEKGTFDHDAKLVSDSVAGYQKDHATGWYPPAEPGPVRLWAVVHDARGGQSVIERTIEVK